MHLKGAVSKYGGRTTPFMSMRGVTHVIAENLSAVKTHKAMKVGVNSNPGVNLKFKETPPPPRTSPCGDSTDFLQSVEYCSEGADTLLNGMCAVTSSSIAAISILFTDRPILTYGTRESSVH